MKAQSVLFRPLPAILFSLLFAMYSAQAKDASRCSFEIDANSIQIDWTAFKTTQKVGVSGSFTEVSLMGDLKKDASFEDFLTQLEAEIDVNHADKIRTGNPGRDITLYEKFFSLIKKKPVFQGSIQNFKGSETEGEFRLKLKMNQKTLAVPMKFTRDVKGGFLAKGAIDLNDFGLGGALKTLNKACEHLHKGPDGVSKTWATVEIKLFANIARTCQP